MSQRYQNLHAVALGGTLLLALAGCGQAGAPSGDAAMGERLFMQCRACHVVAAGEVHTVGPNLNRVVGSKAGQRPGYDYSPALAKSGMRWDAATLDRFIEHPSAVVPGTRMAFAGVPSPKARADLIAYLETLDK